MKNTIITVIITVLIITVGVMGFLLWKGGKQQTKNEGVNSVADVDNKKSSILNDDTNHQINNTIQNNGNNVCETANKVYFPIPELGIKILVDKSIKDDLIYKYEEKDNVKYVYVSFESLIEKDKKHNSCLLKNGGAFSISRQSISDEMRNNLGGVKIIGDEYIRFNRQDRCSYLDNYESMLIDKSMVTATNNYQCIKKLSDVVGDNILSKNNFKQFIDKDFGISFEYPKGLILKSHSMLSDGNIAKQIILDDTVKDKQYTVNIYKNTFSFGDNFRQWYKNNIIGNELISVDSVKIGNDRAFQTIEVDGIDSQGIYVYFLNDGHAISFRCDNNEADKKYLFENILATVKFIK